MGAGYLSNSLLPVITQMPELFVVIMAEHLQNVVSGVGQLIVYDVFDDFL